MWWYLRSAGSTIVSYYGGTISDTDWHHVAWVKNGSSLKAYLDGTEVIDETDTDNDTLSGPLNIGAIKTGMSANAGGFDGYMDEIRISNSERYTGAFTPSTTEFTADANTMLLIHSNWDGGLGADLSLIHI